MIEDTQELARNLLSVTRPVYAVEPWRGALSEPLPHAWQRLFGESMSPPLLFHYVRHEGRDLVVRAHRAGRLSVLDNTTGRHEIRVLRREWEQAVNAARARSDMGPEGQERRENVRMAAAVTRFLQQRAAL